MGTNLKVNGYSYSASPDMPKLATGNRVAVPVSPERLEQDTVSLSEDAKGVEEPKKKKKSGKKKFLIALGLTLATVIGGATLGNKLSNKTALWGAQFDARWANSPTYKKIAGYLSTAKSWIAKQVKKSQTLTDIADTFKNRFAKPVWDMARGYGQGFKSIFSLTPVDTLEKAFKQKGITSVEEGTKLLRQIVGNATDKNGKDIAKQLAQSALGKEKMDRFLFCDLLSEGIRKYTGCGADNVKFTKALIDLQKGVVNGKKVALDFTNIVMAEKGFHPVGNWWPVNAIRYIGNKLGIKSASTFGMGNLGDSLIKYNAVNGTLSKSILGSVIQKSITVPTESITNFVNDKSGLGMFLGASIYSLYNNVQDAPKGKKTATIADDYIGTMGNMALATPLAFATTYGLASFRNLEGKTFLSKCLKPIGKLFGMGLNTVAKDGTVTKCNNKFIGGVGGVMRFLMIMFIITPKFSAPIKKIVNKIFGKPYDKSEEEQKQMLMQQQAQQGTIIPELGISQQELMLKIQQNPQVIAKIQNDKRLAAAIMKNPQLLIDLLDNKK